MRWWIVLVLLALSAVAVAVLLGSREGTPEPSGVLAREAAPAGDLPQLRGAPGASPIPRAVRGRGAIVGRVLAGGKGTRADVELRRGPGVVRTPEAIVSQLLEGGVATSAVLARAVAGEDGAFLFEGLGPGTYELRAEAEGGARASITVTLAAEGARVEAVLEVAAGGEVLRGRVRHEGGAPFQGLVALHASQGRTSPFFPGPALFVGEVDADGRFAASGLAPGAVTLSALLPGSLRVMSAPIALPHAGEYEMVIGGGVFPVRGRVLAGDGETPVAAASVVGGGQSGQSLTLARTTTDFDGRFELTLPGRGGLFVFARGYAPESLEVPERPQAELVVRLRATGRVTGRVVLAEQGAGVPGIHVHATGAAGREALPASSHARTDAEGRFTLEDVPPGTVVVWAQGGGHVSVGLAALTDTSGFNPLAVEVPSGGSVETTLEVEPAGRLEGKVGTASGDAVPGAVLAFSTGLWVERLLQVPWATGMDAQATATDAEGRYALEDLVPGAPHAVRVRAVGHPEEVVKEVTVASGETRRLDVTLRAGRRLVLTLVWDAGGPVTGATVQLALRGDGDEWTALPLALATDAQGVVRADALPSGALGVRIEAPGRVRPQAWVPVPGSDGDAAALEARLVLPAGLALAGRVVVPEGADASRVRLSVRSQDHAPGRGWIWERPPVEVDGRFSLAGLEAGAFELEAELRHDGRRWKAEGVARAGEADVLLELHAEEKGRQLVVRILGPDGGPVSAERVTLTSVKDGSRSSSTRRSAQGVLEFEAPEAGSAVSVEVAGADGGLSHARVGPFDVPASGEIVIRLEPGHEVRGRVVDEAGKGVRGVRVRASGHDPDEEGRDPWARGRRDPVADALTDPEGMFVLRGLGLGTYQLDLAVPPRFVAPIPPQVAGGRHDVLIRLRAAASARLLIVDPAGAPVASASVRVTDPRGERPGRMGLTSDAEGVLTLEGLEPEVPVDLAIDPPAGRTDLKPLQVTGWRPADTTLRFERALTIRGRVVDLAGRPQDGVLVWYRRVGDEAASWSAVRTAADGSFVLQNLDEGEHQLLPGIMGGPMLRGDLDARAERVRAGSADVLVRFDPGATLEARIRGVADAAAFRAGGASLVSEDGRESHWLPPGPDGAYRFRGLDADTRYQLFVWGLPDDRYVLAPGLRPGSTPVLVDPQVGRPITGRLLRPNGSSPSFGQVTARRADGLQVAGTVSRDGTFRIPGLPEGTWTIEAREHTDDQPRTGQATAAPGAQVEIRLAPAR